MKQIFIISLLFVALCSGFAQSKKSKKQVPLKVDTLAMVTEDSLTIQSTTSASLQSVLNEDLTVNGRVVINHPSTSSTTASLHITNTRSAPATMGLRIGFMENVSGSESMQVYDMIARNGSAIGNEYLSYMKGASVGGNGTFSSSMQSWIRFYPTQRQVDLGSVGRTLLRAQSLSGSGQAPNGIVSIGLNDGSDTLKYGIPLFFAGAYENTDQLFIARYNRGSNKSDLRVNIGDDSSGDDRFEIGISTINSYTNWYPKFTVLNNGNIGIGTDQPTYKLDVKGQIRATGVKIESVSNFPDYVFRADYVLPSLQEVAEHIREKGHLPEMPSAEEVESKGVDMVDLQVKLLKKIEELTLYILEQDKKIKTLEERLK